MSTAQMELDLSPIVKPDYAPGLSHAERFALYHERNPHVARALETLAAQWLETNDRVAINALYERLRWESGIRTDGPAYLLDNTFRAYYTRLLISRHPEWASAFRTRKSEADE